MPVNLLQPQADAGGVAGWLHWSDPGDEHVGPVETRTESGSLTVMETHRQRLKTLLSILNYLTCSIPRWSPITWGGLLGRKPLLPLSTVTSSFICEQPQWEEFRVLFLDSLVFNCSSSYAFRGHPIIMQMSRNSFFIPGQQLILHHVQTWWAKSWHLGVTELSEVVFSRSYYILYFNTIEVLEVPEKHQEKSSLTWLQQSLNAVYFGGGVGHCVIWVSVTTWLL